jgi:hypothetical protein
VLHELRSVSLSTSGSQYRCLSFTQAAICFEDGPLEPHLARRACCVPDLRNAFAMWAGEGGLCVYVREDAAAAATHAGSERPYLQYVPSHMRDAAR